MTPRPLNIPSNNPILAKQREHSTCIQPLTTLNYPKSRSRLQKQPHSTDIPPPCGHHQHTSEIRPLLPKLFRRRSGKNPSGMSSQHSTSFEISRDISIEDLSTTLVAVVPYIDLRIFTSQESVDHHASADIWVCIEATVKAADHTPCLPTSTPVGNPVLIPSMRFCYKSVPDCEVLERVGETSLKDLKAGQVSSLFLRLSIPKLAGPAAKRSADAWTQEELFEHLESVLGVYEMDVLQVEVKYRYLNVPPGHVMTVKQVCKVRRTREESAWGARRGEESEKSREQAVGDVPDKLATLRATHRTSSPAPADKFLAKENSKQSEVIISSADHTDSARQLWRDLKRTSLSSHQLVEMSAERVEQLAASDAALKARRQQALANKRSVGAETLRAWKWEENIKDKDGEMPWL